MISIVVPAYNEEMNIENAIKRITRYFCEKMSEFELIIVNDGSTDDTEMIVKDISEKDTKVRLINNPKNMGKGYSIKNGVLHSKGKIVFMIDADLSMSVNEYGKLERWYEKGYPIIIGSKRIKGSKMNIPLNRKIPGLFFGFLVNLLIIKGIKDSQCGFKLFDARIAKEIFGEQKVNGFSFDAEILYLAKKKGILIKEVPITLSDTLRDSKVNVFRDAFRMFFDLINIRFIHR